MSKGDNFEEEKEAKRCNGLLMFFVILFLCFGSFALIIFGGIILDADEYVAVGVVFLVLGILGLILSPLMFMGLKVVNPKEAIVLTLFGKYHGTIKEPGYFFVNPFSSTFNPSCNVVNQTSELTTKTASGNVSTSVHIGRKVSLRANTLNNDVQKVNDELGNPIMIGSVVIWEVENATKAVFNVENYKIFLSTQCDAVMRNTARQFPYDSYSEVGEIGNEVTLRGSCTEVAAMMMKELQEKVKIAGIKIIDMRITHLAYASEIASAMLQRQQAVAIISARQKIVEGAVGMVEMALNKLNENSIVNLDEERKATMISNLLVVLCGNKDAQPIINSGSLY